MKRIFFGLLFLTWALVNSAAAQTSSATPTSGKTQTSPTSAPAAFDAARIEQLRQRMQEFVEAGKTAGSVVLLAQRGDREFTVFSTGYQDLETKTLMGVNSLFQIASMTKPITAIGIMLLFDEGG